MQPKIFTTAAALRSHIQSLPISPKTKLMTVDTHLGELSVAQILARLDNSIESTFAYKNALAKNEGGLGNSKSVRKLAATHSEAVSGAMVEQFEEEYTKHSVIIEEILSQDEKGVFAQMGAKLMDIMRGRSVKGSKEAQADAAIEMVKASVTSLTNRLMHQSDLVENTLRKLSHKLSEKSGMEEERVDIAQRAEKMKLYSQSVKDFALLQISLNEAVIKSMF